MKPKKKKKGFTLIELLVVIAIIGILSSIVFFAMRGATSRARDTKIISAMSQLRSLAELYYNDHNARYADFCSSTMPELRTALDEIDISNGNKAPAACFDSADSYCIKAQLNNDNWWCIDSTAVSKQCTNGEPTDCNGTTFTCGPATACP